MDWLQISIRTSHEAMDLIASIFDDLGANGVAMEDPAIVNDYINSKLWDYTDIPVQKNTEVVVVNAWLPKDHLLDSRLKALNGRIEKLSQTVNTAPCETMFSDIKEEDWANSWKKYFHPSKIGKRIVVKPSWEEYTKKENEIVVELDPGCAFGTGTHPTTTMCIQFMEEYLKPQTRLFDVGTGSGILAICAAKLGVKNIQAADYDNVAVKVAKANIEENNVENVIKCFQSDLLKNFTGKADFISANIIADIVLRLFADLSKKLTKNGIFLASGIIKERLDDIKAAAAKHNMQIVDMKEKGGWVALIIKYREDS
ncbi:50S ribosomal protein L11 methyltransferase [Pectinatus cerevisiiphilus]|uniref:Ribosomal protein L11 methyltransferase n=1 Tax=Pectinatus cerevisiiphilus TaxID=86956 RepID=A0A4R3K524_9FIRM|nr:50S ribosomal protein L11 methyltransferase [Pectinatus cerevisiiphilus]TCS77815.1 ribosomal protein L11 methyltransferase [Pectinatus cerevisiiphilus]